MFGSKLSVTVTTAADGSAATFSVPIQYGLLDRIRYVKAGSGSYADTVDFVITLESTGETLWGEDNVSASATRAPRQPTHTTAGVAATYDGTRAALDHIAIVNDRVLITLANGGDTKTGTFLIFLR